MSKHCNIDRNTLRYEYSWLQFREIEDEVTYLENQEYIEYEIQRQKEELEKHRSMANAPSGWR